MISETVALRSPPFGLPGTPARLPYMDREAGATAQGTPGRHAAPRRNAVGGWGRRAGRGAVTLGRTSEGAVDPIRLALAFAVPAGVAAPGQLGPGGTSRALRPDCGAAGDLTPARVSGQSSPQGRLAVARRPPGRAWFPIAKTVIFLVGLGKTYVGSLLSRRTDIRFLRVEPIWIRLQPGEDGWAKVADVVDGMLANYDRVALESLGAGDGFKGGSGPCISRCRSPFAQGARRAPE